MAWQRSIYYEETLLMHSIEFIGLKPYLSLYCQNKSSNWELLLSIIINPLNQLIEQKSMTFDHDFCYSFPLFSPLLKKRGKKKRRMNSKNRGQKSCLSARSTSLEFSLLMFLLGRIVIIEIISQNNNCRVIFNDTATCFLTSIPLVTTQK